MTYEGFAAAWSSMEGEFADKFNGMPKYVVSSTLEKAEWNNSAVLKGDVVGDVSKLRQGLDGDISGKRLFGDTSDKKRLRLVHSKTVGDGITILVYEPAGEDEAAKA